MQDILDTIQSIARQRGRGESSPLILLRSLDGGQGERIGHLPIDNELAQAWLALLGEPFRPHQAAAVTALRRGEPVALLAANPRVVTSTYLLIYALLVAQSGTAVVFAPDVRAAHAARARLLYINESLPALYRLSAQLIEPNVRPDPAARIVIATPETLHARLLRHHDRAWRQFWPRLQMLALLDIQRYHGVAGAHLADLLLRTQRVAASHSGIIPHILATGYELHEPQLALESLYNAPWKILSGDDLPHTPTALAVWRNTSDRLRESVELARLLQKQGYRIHILCHALEYAAIAPVLDDAEEITFGPAPQGANVLVCAGYPGSQSMIRRLLRSGYQAVIVVLGDEPHEQMLARHTETLLSQGPSYWPTAPLNAYVTAQHVLCAASEVPLTAVEVEHAGVGQIVARLVESNRLIDLPDEEVAWHPGPAAGDPYAEFSVISASGGAVVAWNEQGHQIDLLDPAVFARWCYPGAALPPARGGLRVAAQDEEAASITVRLENNARRTFPLRRCTATLREERESRALFLSGRIGFGRAVIEEEIYSSREYTTGGSPSAQPLRPPQQARWIAPCCWFELTSAPNAAGQVVGWSLAAALALQTLASFTDVVPCLDAEQRRLYVVDAQPGGNGLAAWLYAHAEDLLPLAYDIALACRHDPLLEPGARADMDWLLPLLGRRSEATDPPPTIPAAVEPLKLVFVPVPEVQSAPAGERRIDNEQQKRTTEERRSGRASPTQFQPKQGPASPQPSRGELQKQARRGQTSTGRPVPAPVQPPVPVQPPAPVELLAPVQPPAPVELPAAEIPEPRSQKSESTSTNQPTTDAAALIERLRRQREQREAQQVPVVGTRPVARATAAVELRFQPGDRVFCLPYGEGIVRESRAQDERELLTVDFPQHGNLEIDPTVSLVRKIEDAPAEDDDLL